MLATKITGGEVLNGEKGEKEIKIVYFSNSFKFEIPTGKISLNEVT